MITLYLHMQYPSENSTWCSVCVCVCVCVCVFHSGLRGDELFLWPLYDSQGFFWLRLSCGCFCNCDPFLQMYAQMGSQSLKWTPLQISGLLLFAAIFSEVYVPQVLTFLVYLKSDLCIFSSGRLLDSGCCLKTTSRK